MTCFNDNTSLLTTIKNISRQSQRPAYNCCYVKPALILTLWLSNGWVGINQHRHNIVLSTTKLTEYKRFTELRIISQFADLLIARFMICLENLWIFECQLQQLLHTCAVRFKTWTCQTHKHNISKVAKTVKTFLVSKSLSLIVLL